MTQIIEENKKIDVAFEQKRFTEITEYVLQKAKSLGATETDVAITLDAGFTASVRMGEIDTLEHHRDKGIGITVYFDKHKGSASTSDISRESIDSAVIAACNIAKYTGNDPFSGLPDKEDLAFGYPQIPLYFPWDITPAEAIELALACEAKGMQFDKRLSNSEGASVSSHDGIFIYANSHGFIGGYPTSRHGVSLSLIAKDGEDMQRDHAYTVARDANDLDSIEKIAGEAAKKAINRLHAKRLPTQKLPIIFKNEIACSLVGSFLNAVRGGNLYRKASFLYDHLGKQIFPEFVSLTEKPHMLKGLGSAPFDAEGVRTYEHDIIHNGILNSYVLSSYSARKLGMKTTGNSGGVHNACMSTSEKDFAQLLKTMNKGLLVTELMGQGVNIINGDYSRGAAGFYVENGEIQFPVHEITIAGNLRDMFKNLVCISNDIDRHGSIYTGSILLEEMMIAGM